MKTLLSPVAGLHPAGAPTNAAKNDTTQSRSMIPLHKRPVTQRPLKELSIHPAIADDPRLAPKDPRYLAMQRAWDEQDGVPPIYATKNGQIVDGRHRFWWLEKNEADDAPVIEVTESEVATIVMGALIGRNHITKGQRAYLAAPKLAAYFESAQQRRIEVLASGGKARLPQLATPEEMAEKLGLSLELLRQARKLHDAFADGRKVKGQDGKLKTLRVIFEPQILDAEEPMGLGDALKGVGYFLANSTPEGNRKPNAGRNTHLRNFVVGWRNLVAPAASWEKWDADTRELAADGLREAFAKFPTEVLDLVLAVGRQAKKEHAKAAAEQPEAE